VVDAAVAGGAAV